MEEASKCLKQIKLHTINQAIIMVSKLHTKDNLQVMINNNIRIIGISTIKIIPSISNRHLHRLHLNNNLSLNLILKLLNRYRELNNCNLNNTSQLNMPKPILMLPILKATIGLTIRVTIRIITGQVDQAQMIQMLHTIFLTIHRLTPLLLVNRHRFPQSEIPIQLIKKQSQINDEVLAYYGIR